MIRTMLCLAAGYVLAHALRGDVEGFAPPKRRDDGPVTSREDFEVVGFGRLGDGVLGYGVEDYTVSGSDVGIYMDKAAMEASARRRFERMFMAGRAGVGAYGSPIIDARESYPDLVKASDEAAMRAIRLSQGRAAEAVALPGYPLRNFGQSVRWGFHPTPPAASDIRGLLPVTIDTPLAADFPHIPHPKVGRMAGRPAAWWAADPDSPPLATINPPRRKQ